MVDHNCGRVKKIAALFLEFDENQEGFITRNNVSKSIIYIY